MYWFPVNERKKEKQGTHCKRHSVNLGNANDNSNANDDNVLMTDIKLVNHFTLSRLHQNICAQSYLYIHIYVNIFVCWERY